MTAVIKLQEVSKTLQSGESQTHALRNINLSVFEGDYISIIGPSGAGKSTLLSVMGLLDEACSGEVFVSSQAVSTLNADQKADIRNQQLGFVFQSFNLIDELNIFDNVALPLRIGVKKIAESLVTAQVMKCLELVDLPHSRFLKPQQLSGGQQQRVAIARALSNQPKILFLDEPTGNLDTVNGLKIMNILDELNASNVTICMVTHDHAYAQRAKRQLMMRDGVLFEPSVKASI